MNTIKSEIDFSAGPYHISGLELMRASNLKSALAAIVAVAPILGNVMVTVSYAGALEDAQARGLIRGVQTRFDRPPIAKHIYVQLTKKTDEHTLLQIATEVGASRLSYEQIFVLYHLPEMEGSDLHWASVRLKPRPEIATVGLSEQDDFKLRTAPQPPGRKTLGVWMASYPFASGRVTLYQQGKVIRAEWLTDDMEAIQYSLRQKKSGKSTRYFASSPKSDDQLKWFLQEGDGSFFAYYGDREVPLAPLLPNRN